MRSNAAEGERTACIVLRVEDPFDNREQPVGKQWGWYSTVSGIWQAVFLEPRAAVAIDRFEITPELEQGQASFRIFVNGGNACGVEVTAPDGAQFSANFAVADGVAAGTILVGAALPWDTQNPQLYRVRFTLAAGAERDVVHGYFGMRSMGTQPSEDVAAPAALMLNGHAIYIRGALHQSY